MIVYKKVRSISHLNTKRGTSGEKRNLFRQVEAPWPRTDPTSPTPRNEACSVSDERHTPHWLMLVAIPTSALPGILCYWG